MKNFNYLLLFALFSVSVYLISKTITFNPNTGDEKFDAHLSELNSMAITDLETFKQNISAEYHVEETQFTSLFSVMEPVEILLMYEVSRLINKPISKIKNIFQSHQREGWINILKNLGINNNSTQFKELCNMKLMNVNEKTNSLSKK